MAISTPITSDSGIECPNAYLRVADLLHGKLDGTLVVHYCIAFYADQAAAENDRDNICQPRQFTNVPYDPDNGEPNPYKVCYAHAKTVWIGATDLV